jgi:hypothetical protein
MWLARGPCCYPEGFCVQNTQGDDAPLMQVEDYGQIQPPPAGPDGTEFTRLLPGNGLPANHESAFLVWLVGRKIPVQQISRDVERVVAIRPSSGK